MKKTVIQNLILLLAIVVIVITALVLNPFSEFEGADGIAEDLISEVNPEYEAWFEPFWEPPGSETESLLFALQAALGSGIFCFGLGYFTGKRKKED